VLYGERCRFAVLNAHPGVRVEMALPLEFAAANAETAARRAAADTRISGGAGA